MDSQAKYDLKIQTHIHICAMNPCYKVTITHAPKATGFRITLSKDITLFDALVSEKTIKVLHIVLNTQDSLLDLFKYASVKYNRLIIPGFFDINFILSKEPAILMRNRINIKQDVDTFPKMFPCTLVLNFYGFVTIGNLSVETIHIQTGTININEHLITDRCEIKSALNKIQLAISSNGIIETQRMELEKIELKNYGQIKSNEFNSLNSKIINYDGGILDTIDMKLSETESENLGILKTNGFFQHTGSFANKSSGSWSGTGCIDMGSMLLINCGSIYWENVNLNLESSLSGYHNHGTWVFDNVTANTLMFITNHSVLHLKDNQLNFNRLINHNNLIIASGKYHVHGLQNKGLISFVDNEYQMDQGKTCNAKNYLLIDEYGPVGKIEAEKSFTYNIKELPDQIVAQGHLTFSDKYLRSLNDLKKIKSDAKVFFHITAITMEHDIEIQGIRHLVLHVHGDFINPWYIFKALGLTLIIDGTFVNGSSNSVMGMIQTTDTAPREYKCINMIAVDQGMLTISARGIDNRFGKIYGARSAHIVTRGSGDILNGNPINSSGPYKYAMNGAYIASGWHIYIEAHGEFKNYYGQTYSKDLQQIIAYKKITNTAGEITSGGSIYFTTPSFTNTRDGTYTVPVPNWTWAYSGCYNYCESSDQGLIRALHSITFRVDQGTNLASSILAQKDIRYASHNSTDYKTSVPASFTSIARSNYGYGCNDKVGYQQGCNPCSVYPSILMAGQSISINAGTFNISSNMNAQIIEITAKSGKFHNPVRGRDHVNSTETIFIDLTQWIQGQVANKKGFLTLDIRGIVKSEIPPSLEKNISFNESSLNLITDQNQHLYKIPLTQMHILNPLASIPPEILDLFIQRALSETAGKLYIHDTNKRKCTDLTKTLMSNTQIFKWKIPESNVRKDDLCQISYAMVLQELKQINGQIQTNQILCLPPQEINEYQSEGDIVCDSFTSRTQGDQEHVNNRIIARDILNIISEKGSVHRRTESYRQEIHTTDSLISQDVGMPKQIFRCLNGDINIQAHHDIESIGTDTLANGNIKEMAGRSITSKPLILHKSVVTKQSDNGLFSTNQSIEISESCDSIGSRTIGKSITKIAKESIEQSGTHDIGKEIIEYDAKHIQIEAEILVCSHSLTKESGNSFTTKTESVYQESAQHVPALIHAPTVIFKGDDAILKGCDISGQIIEDQTKNGLKIGPKIKELKYINQMTVDSPGSHQDIGCKGGYEVMVKSRICVDKIIRLLDDKEIVLDSVEWDKKRTEIIGKFIETIYCLKRWEISWSINQQIVPDGALILVGVAVSFATYGTGATLIGATGSVNNVMSAMASAGFTTLCCTASTTFLKTGDPLMTAKAMLSDQGIRNLAINVASAGCLANFGHLKPNISQDIPGFIDFVKYNAIKSIINIPLITVIGLKPLDEVLKNEATNCLVDSLQGFTASQIGQMYKNSDLGFLSHKFMHAVNGGITGGIHNLILNKPMIDGALSGAIGATVGELAGELNPLNIEDIDTRLFTSKIIAGTVGLLLKQDVDLCVRTATNTIENNLLPYLLAALTAIEITHVVKDALDALEENGVEAAIDTLILHGVIMRLEHGLIHYGGLVFSKSKHLWKQLSSDKNIWKQITEKRLDPSSVINRDLLYHQLQIQEKMGEVGTHFAGAGTGTIFKNEKRIVEQYGGQIGEWVKTSSSKFTTKSGCEIELHWIENIVTGQRVEYKQKLVNKIN